MHWKAFEIHLSVTFAHLLPEIRPVKSDILIFLENRTGAAMAFLIVPKWHCHLPLYEANTATYNYMKPNLSMCSKTLQFLLTPSYARSTHDRVSKHSCKTSTDLIFFRINSALKIGMIKLEAKAKKNILNPLCFCAVPNIIIKEITKASFLCQNKMCSYLKEEKMKNTLQHQ